MSGRTDLMARLPWVTRLEQTQECDGYRYAHMPLKALRDPEVRAKYKCKARARWRFRALKRGATPARDGTYCWSHLWALGLYHGLDEEARTRRGLEKVRAADELLDAVLDGTPGAYEHAAQNLERARAGETISLDELEEGP